MSRFLVVVFAGLLLVNSSQLALARAYPGIKDSAHISSSFSSIVGKTIRQLRDLISIFTKYKEKDDEQIAVYRKIVGGLKDRQLQMEFRELSVELFNLSLDLDKSIQSVLNFYSHQKELSKQLFIESEYFSDIMLEKIHKLQKYLKVLALQRKRREFVVDQLYFSRF